MKVGSWEVEAVLRDVSGRTQKRTGDSRPFIYPRRSDRQSGRPAQGDRYGTTIKGDDARVPERSQLF